MKRSIITDLVSLRKPSENVDIENVDISKDIPEIIDLWDSFPEHAVGLAAPQIGIHKRVFVAKLSCGEYAFVNPQIACMGYNIAPSRESCLSLPGVLRTVGRSPEVYVSADKIIKRDGTPIEFLRLEMFDAFVVQHEQDHLDGILLIDLKEYEFINEQVRNRMEDRQRRIQEKRNKKLRQKFEKNGASAKKTAPLTAKDKKKEQKKRKKERQVQEIRERYLIAQQDLFNNAAPNSQ